MCDPSLTIYPFRQGKMIAWDASCVNIFSSTNLTDYAATAGTAACSAESRKRHLYAEFCQRQEFMPLTVEMTGILGPALSDLLKTVSKRSRERKDERRETEWLRQRISLTVIH